MEGFFSHNTNMSLEPITVWAQRYILRCDPRTDLDENLGTLPDRSLYVGSSSGLTHRLCYQSRAEPTCGREATVRPVRSERLYLPEEEESDGCAKTLSKLQL